MKLFFAAFFSINSSHYNDPCDDDSENEQGCMQEECFREYRDDRVRMRIENPVIVPEEQFMEQDERAVEINGKHGERDDSKQREGNGSCSQKVKVAELHMFPDSNYADDPSHNKHEVNGNEESLNILKMNASGS